MCPNQPDSNTPKPSAANAWSARDDRAVRAVALQFLVNGVVAAAWVPRLPEIRDQLGVNLSVLGLIITLTSVGGVIGSSLAPVMLARFGARRLMLGGTSLIVLLLPSVAWAANALALVLVLLALRFVDVLIDIAMNLQASALSERRASPVMHRMHGIWSVGSVLGGVAAASAASIALPLTWHLLGVSLVLALVLLVIGAGLPADAIASEKTAGDETTSNGFMVGRVWVYAILGACALIPEMILSDWAAFRLRDDLHTSSGLASFGYVAFTVGMVCARLSGDWLQSRWGLARLLRVALALSLSGAVLVASVDRPSAVLFGLLLAGLGISAFFPSLYAAAAKGPGRQGAALGALTAGGNIAALATPVALGSLAATNGFNVGGAMLLLILPALACLWWLWRQPPR